MFDDDDENKSDSDSSSSDESSSSDSSPSSIEGSEPPPAGDDTEPAPAGESSSSDDPSDKPLEDNEGHSDSSAERDTSEDSSSSSSSSSDSSSDSSSSSSDSSDGGKSVQPPSSDDVADALTHAFSDHDVPMYEDMVKVDGDSGYYKISCRLSSNFTPLSQVQDDKQSLSTGSITGAMYMINGAVQVSGDQVRVTMRIVSVETSAILEASSGDGSGSVLDAIKGAAGDALAGLPSLNAS